MLHCLYYNVLQIVTKNMRTILNISVPAELAREVKREVKAGKFASTSEYFRHIMRVRNTEKLAAELKKEQQAFRKGKYKVLTSLRDLRS